MIFRISIHLHYSPCSIIPLLHLHALLQRILWETTLLVSPRDGCPTAALALQWAQNTDGLKALRKMRLTCRTEVSSYHASVAGVTRQNQMHIDHGRHRGWGSLGCICHCASALPTLPKAAFLQFPNTVYGMQMLVLHIRSHSRQEMKHSLELGNVCAVFSVHHWAVDVLLESNVACHCTQAVSLSVTAASVFNSLPRPTDSFLELYERYQKHNPTEVSFWFTVHLIILFASPFVWHGQLKYKYWYIFTAWGIKNRFFFLTITFNLSNLHY